MIHKDMIAFLKKKNGTKVPVQKVYEARFGPVQKISTRYKSTFNRLHDARQAGIPKWRKVYFLLTVSMSDGHQENAIFTGKTHLLNRQEGRERVGGSAVFLRRGGCGSSKEGMAL